MLEIGTTVDGIFTSASSINTSVLSIGSAGKSILKSAREINSSAKSILTSGGGILTRVNSIDKAVATIVGLATDIDNTAKPIKQDFIGIDANVAQQGRGGNFASTINGHANSIDCSVPFDILGLDDTLAPILGGITDPVRFGGTGCSQ